MVSDDDEDGLDDEGLAFFCDDCGLDVAGVQVCLICGAAICEECQAISSCDETPTGKHLF